jgi:hypothetical protein
MGLLQSRGQSLGAAAALIFALSLAGLGTSQAAPSRVSGTNHVNGLPCNDLCKAYMAWSDQVIAKWFRPPQRHVRVVVSPKKPDRAVHHASAPRKSSLNVFAQLARPSDPAPPPAETQHVQPASSEPVQPSPERLSSAEGTVAATPADAVVATNASLETTPVSTTGLVSAPQDAGTTGPFARGLDGRFVLSLALALCALLSLFAWVCFRGWTQTVDADTFR